MTQSMWQWPWLPDFTPSSRQEPLSGDVSQWLRFFSPTINVNGRGEPDLEGEIVRDVATYGSQLGQLTALVLAMVPKDPPKGFPKDALTKLTEIAAEIEARKAEYQGGPLRRARKALEELEASEKGAAKRLLDSFVVDG